MFQLKIYLVWEIVKAKDHVQFDIMSNLRIISNLLHVFIVSLTSICGCLQVDKHKKEIFINLLSPTY